jgi:hypothetical protein
VSPTKREVWTDLASDLALISVTEAEVKRSGQTVSTAVRGWPPLRPSLGSYVLFSGHRVA